MVSIAPAPSARRSTFSVADIEPLSAVAPNGAARVVHDGHDPPKRGLPHPPPRAIFSPCDHSSSVRRSITPFGASLACDGARTGGIDAGALELASSATTALWMKRAAVRR